MNIESNTKINPTQNVQTSTTPQNDTKSKSDVKFSDELKNAAKNEEKPAEKECAAEKDSNVEAAENDNSSQNEDIEGAINGLQGAVEEIKQINRIDEKDKLGVKNLQNIDDKDNKNEDLGLIDNNMNIQEPKDKLNAQMNSNMNFNSDGKPFTEFINGEQGKDGLKSNAKDIAEEKAILSTMEENVAIANKNMALKESQEKTVTTEHAIKKVNKNTNITVDTIVNYDSVIMDKNDVEFFAKLVNEGAVNLHEVVNSSHSSAVSKTLADLLAKSMQDNKPVRIDFDNDISVIIKIGRDGKISADFLPSSNIAEAYLRDNLPLLRQKFDDNNIDYDELNQRKQKQDDNDNRKKGRKDE